MLRVGRRSKRDEVDAGPLHDVVKCAKDLEPARVVCAGGNCVGDVGASPVVGDVGAALVAAVEGIGGAFRSWNPSVYYVAMQIS